MGLLMLSVSPFSLGFGRAPGEVLCITIHSYLVHFSVVPLSVTGCNTPHLSTQVSQILFRPVGYKYK